MHVKTVVCAAVGDERLVIMLMVSQATKAKGARHSSRKDLHWLCFRYRALGKIKRIVLVAVALTAQQNKSSKQIERDIRGCCTWCCCQQEKPKKFMVRLVVLVVWPFLLVLFYLHEESCGIKRQMICCR